MNPSRHAPHVPETRPITPFTMPEHATGVREQWGQPAAVRYALVSEGTFMRGTLSTSGALRSSGDSSLLDPTTLADELAAWQQASASSWLDLEQHL